MNLSKIKVVLDTNVLISGLLFGGNCSKVIRIVIEKKLDLYINEILLGELISTLENKFKLKREYISSLIQELMENGNLVEPKESISICRDPKDNFILEIANESKSNFIVTGDKDLLVLKKWQEILILSPYEFLQYNSIN